MYDELIKRLRELHPEEFGDAWDFAFACQQAMHEAADAIEELSKEVDKWKAKYAECFHRSMELFEENQNFQDVFRPLHEPRWIPVTERLPEDLTRVIVFCEDGVSYGLCEHLIAGDEEVVEWHDFLHYPITPTHWMPLPEPPKEE